MARKPRSDAKLHNLPLEQQQELCEWLLSGMPYVAVRAAVLKEFNVGTSTGALHDFYHSFCAPELLRRRAEAVSTADAIAEEAAATPGKWDEAVIDKLKQRVFEMMLNPGAEAKDVKSLFGLVLKARDQSMDERKIRLLEAAASEAKRKLEEITNTAKAKGGITPETLAQIEVAAGLL